MTTDIHEIKLQIDNIEDDIILVLQDSKLGSEGIKESLTSILNNVSLHLQAFYSLKREQLFIDLHANEISRIFERLSTNWIDFLEVPFWNIGRLNKLSAKSKKDLALVYQTLFAFQSLRSSYLNMMENLINKIRDNALLSKRLSYFKDNIREPRKIPLSLTSALNHFSSEIQSYSNIRSAIIGTILGVFLGVLLTYLFSSS